MQSLDDRSQHALEARLIVNGLLRQPSSLLCLAPKLFNVGLDPCRLVVAVFSSSSFGYVRRVASRVSARATRRALRPGERQGDGERDRAEEARRGRVRREHAVDAVWTLRRASAVDARVQKRGDTHLSSERFFVSGMKKKAKSEAKAVRAP